MSSVPPAAPDFIPDDEMPDFISDEEMAQTSGAPAALAQRSAASRFMEPIGQAAKALASLPGTAARAMAESPMGMKAGWEMARGIADDSAEQAVQAVDAAGRGDYGEAAGRALASIPVVGPAGAQMGEAVKEGNYAGALGQAVVNFAPGAPVSKIPVARTLAKVAQPTAISQFLKRRAAARILDVMRPRQAAVAAAEDVAPEVVAGLAERQAAGGIGVGSLKTLSARAKARAKAAGQDVQALQALDTPLNPKPVSSGLRREASGLETTPPPREVLDEVPTGLLDEAGDPIMGIKSRMVEGVPTSGHKPLVAALRREAEFIDDLAAQYPDELVPAGELFKQRAAIGRRVGKAYNILPGDEAAAAAGAGKSSREGLSDFLHEKVPASRIPDREYRVFRTAWTNFERHRRAALTNRGLKGLKDLLAGRLVGALGGAAAGFAGGGIPWGVAGAIGGAVLGESAYWGSLRAATYARLAGHLNRGQLDQAAELIQRTSAAYAADQGIRERERHRKAQRALQQQAEGVVPP